MAQLTQRSMMAVARRHGVTQEALAAHLGKSRGYVSQFTVSGPQHREMTVGELIGLLELVGEGTGAADVLRVLAADRGVVVRSEDEDEATVTLADAARETSEALAAVLHPDTDPAVLAKECREAAAHLQLVADRAVAG